MVQTQSPAQESLCCLPQTGKLDEGKDHPGSARPLGRFPGDSQLPAVRQDVPQVGPYSGAAWLLYVYVLKFFSGAAPCLAESSELFASWPVNSGCVSSGFTASTG